MIFALSIGDKTRTILVVDDEQTVIHVVDRLLTARGFRVIAANSASDALAAVLREPVHLIISDVHMPGLPGPELLANLRRSGVDAPVLFISGDLEIGTVERALDVRDASFLPKPFTAEELFTAVSTSLR